ncbi:MAG: hypothetical protein ACYCWW_14615, partial [Deltaproteobacteria bacterium]
IGDQPYPNGPWNKPLPADVMSHLAPSSDAIAQATFIDLNGPGGTQANGRWGFWTLDQHTGVNDSNESFYYGEATDPWYVFKSCYAPGSGIHDPIGIPFHAPNDAVYSNANGGDQFFTVWDQTSGLVFTNYNSGGAKLIGSCACPGTGPSSCACTVQGPEYCAVSSWASDPGIHIGGGDSLGSGDVALHIRQEEWVNLSIGHALYLQSSCTNGVVFPSGGGTYPCSRISSSLGSHAANGALLFFDYTPSQLAAMNIPDWQRAVVTAMSTYGGYVGDTTNSGCALCGHRAEGPAAYDYAGLAEPAWSFWTSRVNGQTVTSGTTSSAGLTVAQIAVALFDLVDRTSGKLIRLTGPGGQDSSGHACNVAPGCDVSGHVHLADPCIAAGLMNLPTSNPYGVSVCH